jgi:hypothetical protein
MWQMVTTSIAANLRRPKPHKMKATFVTKVITTTNFVPKVSLCGEEKQQWHHVPRTTDFWTCRIPPSQALCHQWFVLSMSCKSKRPMWPPMQQWTVLAPLTASKCQCHLTIMMTVVAIIIVICQHTHKTIAPLQLNRLQQATISWYWHSKSWSQTVVGQQEDRFIQQLLLLLAHMPKKDCPCNCTHKYIRWNMDNHHCECLPVLKEEGIKSWSCRHCVPVHLVLMRSQISCN